MNTLVKLVLRLIAGIFLGVTLLFLAMVAAIAFAFATKGEAFIPGVFKAWFGTENGLPSLYFEPSGTGMLLIVVLIAVAYVFGMFQLDKRTVARNPSRAE